MGEYLALYYRHALHAKDTRRPDGPLDPYTDMNEVLFTNLLFFAFAAVQERAK